MPRKRNPTRRPPTPAGVSLSRCLRTFKRVLRQTQLQLALQQEGRRFYERIFTPVVTLWYMIFQRLSPDHSLQAAVLDLHAGGADQLSPCQKPLLSERIHSLATTAFSKARERLPLALFHTVLAAQAQDLWEQAREHANGGACPFCCSMAAMFPCAPIRRSSRALNPVPTRGARRTGCSCAW